MAGNPFEQQDYQTSMAEKMSPIPHRNLEIFIRHNTVLFIQKVVVRRLSRTKNGTVWSFLVPERTEDLACHMFDLSLGCNVIDYQCGKNLYDPDLKRDFWADVITVVESRDGDTNITPELIHMMNIRYRQVNAN